MTSLENFQRSFPATIWNTVHGAWTFRDTDQDAARVPIVMLPGAGANGDTFYRTVEGLRETRRVISVSYPALDDTGHLASGLLAALSEAGVAEFDLFGSSLGGYMAQMCALRDASRIRRCMFANTFYDAGWLQRRMSREKLQQTAADEHLANTLNQLRQLSEDTVEKADFKRTMLALVGTAQTAEMAKAALLAVLGAHPLPRVDLPEGSIAVLDTKDDSVVDDATREALRERYLGSRHFRLGTGGHYPGLLNPTEFLAALLQHFRGD